MVGNRSAVPTPCRLAYVYINIAWAESIPMIIFMRHESPVSV